ncbi:MAG: Chromosome partition protein Smc [Mycoplasmataceae bacterium]|nr:MAG: Chromosome partition protein Smc [Mycoplasmataceae bacterium]
MKCGFIDCNNPKAKECKDCCQDCKERKEWDICWACQKTQKSTEESYLNYHLISLPSIYHTVKSSYLMGKKFKEFSPAQFKNEIEPIINELKLSKAEERILWELEKMTLDFCVEKGGKQYNTYWFNFCSDCLTEVNKKHENFINQNPKHKNLNERFERAKEKIGAISERIQQEVGEQKWKELEKRAIEEVEEEYENTQKSTIQLQQEISNLKQEINELRNSRNSSSSNPSTLQEKETQLRTKERELESLNENDNSLNNNNSKLPFYVIFAIMGIVIFFLITLLIEKKQKK